MPAATSRIRRWSLGTARGTTADAERVEEVWSRPGWRIERIESLGHVAPDDGAWYDQDEDEWVLVLSGAGRLQVEGEPEEVVLGPGDAIWLPAHRRHRVTWTDPGQPTVWIALFSQPHREP